MNYQGAIRIQLPVPIPALVKVPVLSALNSGPPLAIMAIPGNGLLYAGLEIIVLCPSQLSHDFGTINGIAAVMARTVFNKTDQ